MKSHHGNGRGKSGGGWFCHVRDESGSCQWAYCVRRARGMTMTFKVFPDDSDQILLRSDCRYGAGRGEWHHPGQCRLTELEMLQAAALSALRGRETAARVPAARN